MLGENPFLSDPNINKVRKALSALDFLVVQDIFLTETAEFADVILPASLVSGEGRHLHQHRPPGAARPQGARPARRCPGRLGDRPGHRQPARGSDWNYASARRDLRRDGARSMPELHQPDLRQPRARTGKLYPNPDPEHSDGIVVLFDEKFNTDDGLAHLVPAEWLPAKEAARARSTRSCSTPDGCWSTGTPGSMTRRSFALDSIAPRRRGLRSTPSDAAELRPRRRRAGPSDLAVGARSCCA